MANELLVAKLILGALFIVPVLHALIMTIVCWFQSRLWWKTNKLFYFIVALHCSIRSITMFIPNSVYVVFFRMGAVGMGIQNIFDLTPEISYFLGYVLILLSWMEIYHQSKALRVIPNFNKKASMTSLLFIIIMFLSFFLVFFMSVVIALIPGLDGDAYPIIAKVQGVILAVLAALATLGFFLYFISLQHMFFRLRKATQTNIASSSTVGRTIYKVTILGIIYLGLLIFRASYILVLNNVLSDLYRVHKVISVIVFVLIWSSYFLFTELLPFATILLILLFFDHLPRVRRIRFKKRRENENRREKEKRQFTKTLPANDTPSSESTYTPPSNQLYFPEPREPHTTIPADMNDEKD